MLVYGTCCALSCPAKHCTYGTAVNAYMSSERPARLPEPRDGLTSLFKPSLFEVAVVSPFHTADPSSLASADSTTAVLPLPIAPHLLSVYRSRTFVAELLSVSNLSESNVRLLLAANETQLSTATGQYGFAILSGPLRRVRRGIETIIDAVQRTAAKLAPAAPKARTVSPTAEQPVAPPCGMNMQAVSGCYRHRCPLPDESHLPYVEHLIRHLDTSERALTAIPPFVPHFTFTLCRKPSTSQASVYLCSLTVPNLDRVRGYVIGRNGGMTRTIEHESGTQLVCNRHGRDSMEPWMTFSAMAELSAVDAVVETIVFLIEGRNTASIEHLTEHMQQWKQQRAIKADRPMLWSMLSRNVHSAKLDALFASNAPPPPHSSAEPEGHRRQYSPVPARNSRSRTDPPTIPVVNEPCSRGLLLCCNDGHCSFSHTDKPYAAWLAERIQCHSSTMRELHMFERHFTAVLNNNSGQPVQPLLVSLPIPSIIIPYRLLRQYGPLSEVIRQRAHVFLNVPRIDGDLVQNRPWAMIRARGDTRQVDAIIEWVCWLIDDWKKAGYMAKDAQQRGQARRLSEHLDRWLQSRAEYVAKHGEALYAFVSRRLAAQPRLSFPLPAASHSDESPATNTSNLSPGSTTTSSSASSASDRSSLTRRSPSPPTSSSASHTPPPPSSASPPSVEPQQLLDSLRAAGRRLGYTSFVQHPSFSGTAQPFIRVLADQAFGCWPIPAAWRDTFVWTLDETAMPLSRFEEKWDVDVYVPPAAAAVSGGGGAGGEWCNVCVKMKLSNELGSARAMVAMAAEKRAECVLDDVMLAVMQRAKRVEQLTM